jgi:hypothetical protein
MRGGANRGGGGEWVVEWSAGELRDAEIHVYICAFHVAKAAVASE